MYDFPAAANESPLRKFIGLQKDALLILGPRRVPPLSCPSSSTSTSIAIVTSLGFTKLECAQYVEAVQRLRPDIVVGLGDVLYGHQPGVKRAERMGDRTQAWLNALKAGMNTRDGVALQSALFAPIPPIEAEKQSWYLAALENELKDDISGLVLYETDSFATIPTPLLNLPRLWLGEMNTPHQLLDAISVGTDLFTIPFVNEATDAGIAFDFSFGSSEESLGEALKPLGLDLWSSSYATDLSPLRKGCLCYACTNHHRAYIQHLLNAKEMLSWVLLQLHNYHVMDELFSAVRQSIQHDAFDEHKLAFSKQYQRYLPAKTGQGPRYVLVAADYEALLIFYRARGYQFKSEGKGEPRKNPVAYRSLNDREERLAEAVSPNPKSDAVDLEQVGFAEIFGETEG